MLGDILREARKNKNLTLAELAGKIGVSSGYLSNLEKNRQEPSLSVLKDLSGKLGIALPMLFMEEDTEEVIVLRKEERTKIKYQNLANFCEVLTPMVWRSTDPSEFQVLRMEVPGESKICIGDLSTDMDECIYVEEGQLEYRYGNGSIPIPKSGSIFIPKRTGHFIYNPSKEPATIVWIIKNNFGGQ